MDPTLRFGVKKLKNILTCITSLCTCGLNLPPYTLVSAELWLQTYEAQHSDAEISWAELCVAVESKFGRDLYHNAMNDLLNIKQTSDVQEYYDRFQSAMHKVLVHNKSLDDVFFVSKFLQGFNSDIQSAIILHKPRMVDAALSLALMQASVLESQPKPVFKKYG
jgi:hypothetical protein